MITMEAHNVKLKLKDYIDWFLHLLWETHVVIVDKRNNDIAMLTAFERSLL